MSCSKNEPLDSAAALEICQAKGQVTSDDLIPILQEIQDAYGYLPPGVLMTVSEETGIPASRIYGVTSFYEQFHLEPRGRHTIKCCRGTACHVRDGAKIISMIRNILGIEPGQTTEDMRFTFETVACLGTCFLAPVIVINDDYYGHVSPNKVKSIINGYV